MLSVNDRLFIVTSIVFGGMVLSDSLWVSAAGTVILLIRVIALAVAEWQQRKLR
jgi:hypothetical protein